MNTLIRLALTAGAVILFAGTLSGCGHDAASGRESRPPTASIPTPIRSPESAAILRVLTADGKIAPSNINLEAPARDYVTFVVGRMRSLTLEGCPDDFRAAYQAHIAAWQRMLRTTIDHSNEVKTVKAWNDILVLHGMEPRNDLEREFFAASAEIKSTFEVCTEIADRYRIRQSEYDPD